ncbi:hypothetical protein CH063_15479, partial [Colletotrichum higginsianum]
VLPQPLQLPDGQHARVRRLGHKGRVQGPGVRPLRPGQRHDVRRVPGGLHAGDGSKQQPHQPRRRVRVPRVPVPRWQRLPADDQPQRVLLRLARRGNCRHLRLQLVCPGLPPHEASHQDFKEGGV